MKVAFFCQHLLGIGHVSRSLALVNELSKDFTVTYIQGGPATRKKPNGKVKILQLSPLLMRERDSSLYDPLERKSVEQIFEDRKRELEKHLKKTVYDALLIELWPFGRNKFSSEMKYIIEEVKNKNPKVKVVCSLRDILVRKKDEVIRNQKIVNIIHENFDAILVHSDEALISLADSFTSYKMIENKIIYTGFVTEPSKLKEKVALKKNKIVVSMGGGVVGEELLISVAKVTKYFPNYEFQFILGPFAESNLKIELEKIKEFAGVQFEVSGLLDNFEEVLLSSALSISLAGYNTVMNLLNTKTYGLVYPYDANEEQRTRAKKLENLGVLKILTEQDIFEESKLVRLIESALRVCYPSVEFKLDGAPNSSEVLKQLLEEKE